MSLQSIQVLLEHVLLNMCHHAIYSRAEGKYRGLLPGWLRFGKNDFERRHCDIYRFVLPTPFIAVTSLSLLSGGPDLDVLGAFGFRACNHADPRGVRRFSANVARSRDKRGALLQAHAHWHRHRQIRQHQGMSLNPVCITLSCRCVDIHLSFSQHILA